MSYISNIARVEYRRFHELFRSFMLYNDLFYVYTPFIYPCVSTIDVGADFEPRAILASGILISNVMRVLRNLLHARSGIIHSTRASREIHRRRSMLSAICGSALHRMVARIRLSRSPNAILGNALRSSRARYRANRRYPRSISSDGALSLFDSACANIFLVAISVLRLFRPRAI